MLSQGEDYKWWVLVAVVLGTLLTVMDLSTLSVALPTVGTYFGANIPSVQWVVLANALTISALLLPMGRAGDIIGRKPIFMIGLTVFVLGSVLAGLSTSLMMLILSRVVQGAGAAMVQGNAMAMALAVFPGSERGKVIGLNMSAVGLGSIAGPIVGGLLVTTFGWRSIFVVTGGIGLFALVVGSTILDGRRFAPESTDGRHPRFDWLGAGLSAIAMLVFLLVMTNGYQSGWLSPLIVLGMAAFAVFAVAFVWWELRFPSPLFELRLFKRRVFAFAAGAAWMSFLGAASLMFVMPFFLQEILGYSPREVGLILIPSAVCMAVIAPLAGRLSDRFGWRWFTIGGLTVSITAMLTFSATLSVGTSIALVIPVMMLRFVGHALFNSPNANSLFSEVERSRYGAVSALTQVIRNSGSVTGIAIVTMVIAGTMSSMGFEPSLDAVSAGDDALAEAFMAGARRGFLVLSGLLVVALAFSIFKEGKVDPPERAANDQSTEVGQAAR